MKAVEFISEGRYKLPEPVIHTAKAGSFECPNCGVLNKIDPKKIKKKFAYTDSQTSADHYYPMQACDQCGINHEIADHSQTNESEYLGEGPADNEEQIAAISQLIADRTEDENSPSKLSTEAFIGLVNKMGLPLTKETLMDLVQKGHLSSIIKDVNMEEIQFKGQSEIDPTDMTVDKAKNVVANMAKRAAKKGINKEGKGDDNKIEIPNQKVRKQTSGYGLLGTKYPKKPKFRDKPRNRKVDY